MSSNRNKYFWLETLKIKSTIQSPKNQYQTNSIIFQNLPTFACREVCRRSAPVAYIGVGSSKATSDGVERQAPKIPWVRRSRHLANPYHLWQI